MYGTRPEAIKIGPIAAELRAFGVEPTIISTGQHDSLLAGTPAKTDLAGSCSLNLPSHGDVSDWVAKAVRPIYEALETMKPIAALVVQGDTMSAYAGSKAAKHVSVPIAHVEAGLRSHNILEPWPEEAIRKAISKYADWHYAPTESAKWNLIEENVHIDKIHVTGNTVVSAIARYTNQKPVHHPEQQIFVTMHRREWTGLGAFHVIETINALFDAARKYPLIRFFWPMHPNVLKISGTDPRLTPDNVFISPPIAYEETIKQLARSMGVATDSGGLQEEAAVLGVPCAVMRNVSDREESIEAGVAELFAPTDVGMTCAIRCLANEELPRKPLSVYGTADSAKHIAKHLASLT